MKIAFRGEPGAYSEQAVFEYFGEGEPVSCDSFDDIFDAVTSRECDTGIVPIENTLAGSIHQNYDLLMRNNLFIVGEYHLRVRHCLIVNPGAKMEQIRTVYSHPQALRQCADYLRRHKMKPEEGIDTAGSVKALKKLGAMDMASIASRRAAEIYGMEILEEGIEDNPENYTRFLVIQREPTVPKGDAKTSLVFTLNNVPGALVNALNLFALRGINLTKIESRPLHGRPWEYLFYVDLDCSAQDARTKEALALLSECTPTLRVLGSYPRFHPNIRT
jgi:prephenate dehydratase